MKDLNLTYANNIVALRKLHGLSRHNLAEHLGVTYNTIKKLEIAPDFKAVISYKHAEDLAKLFNVSVLELVGDEPLSFKIKLTKKAR